MSTATKVLVVDDSAMVQKLVTRILETAGFTAVVAVDGLDALEKLGGHPDTALVVCDVNMPRMNGLELLERMLHDGMKFPVVMLTTEGQPEMMQRAKSLGAKGWLLKPFKPEVLVATVRKLTGSAELAGSTGAKVG